MEITQKDGHTVVLADPGNYVGFPDKSCFGEGLSLGIDVTINQIVEKPFEWWFDDQDDEL